MFPGKVNDSRRLKVSLVPAQSSQKGLLLQLLLSVLLVCWPASAGAKLRSVIQTQENCIVEVCHIISISIIPATTSLNEETPKKYVHNKHTLAAHRQ